MDQFASLCASNQDFVLMLKSPIVGKDKKQSILNAIFEGKVSDISLSFFQLITKKNRADDLVGIAKELVNQYNIKKGVKKAVVKTAVALTAAQKKAFEEVVAKATSSSVELEEEVNEELIGGYILRVEDKQIDATVKSQLSKVKKQLTIK
jgi:F-type H+-transporting ATPase subunit delta